MALTYITANENTFEFGIDARSAENQIQPGFVKDLLNGDIVEKRPRTRKGYQGFAGNIPVRVTGLQYVSSGTQIRFTLDSGSTLATTDVDLNSVRSTPIVVYGRSSSISSGGPFTSAADSVHYYSAFTVPTRKTFLATASSPPLESITILEAETSIPTTDMYLDVVESTDTINRSYQTALPHDVSWAESTADVTIQYQNSTGMDRDVYVYYRNQTATVGSSYVGTLSHGGAGSQVFTIALATHALTNRSILVQVQEDNGATRSKVRPEKVLIKANGDVELTLNSSTATTFYAILAVAPIANQVTGNVAGNSTSSLQLSNLTSPWIFYGVYLELTPGGDKELVTADTIDYDDSTAEATLTFTNQDSSARNFVTYYDYGTIRSNQLCVTDASVSVDATDSRPQLTVWGLDHTEIYSADASTRAGWSNHIDSYRSAGERRMVTGLGGNMFSARTYAEEATPYAFPFLYPNLQARTASSMVLGPLLWDSGDAPGRARGYITADASGSGWASVPSVQFDSGTGWTKYTLSLPNKLILNSAGVATTLGAVVSTTTDLEDWLTITNMPNSRLNGTFRIMAAVDGVDQVTVSVDNAGIDSSDYDDANCLGSAGVFTDQFTWLTTSPFLPGDALSSAALGDTVDCSVLSSSGTVSVVSGFVDRLDVAGGILTTGRRTSSVIPLRAAQPAATASTTNLVRGDMLDYLTGDTSWNGRLLRVLFVNSDGDRPLTLTGDGTTATAVLGTGDTSFLSVGNSVILANAGQHSGTVTITGIPTSSSFEFASTVTESASGTLAGNTAEIDEQFEWEDSSDDSRALYAPERWIPVEAPDDSYDLTPNTHVRYFDSSSYGDQSFLRSTMVQNNMYLTNGEDELLKYDGTNLYRAGLFSWQPGLFVTQDTSPTAKIVISNRSVAYSAISATGGYVTVAYGNQGTIPIGTDVRLSGSTATYTVRAIANADTTTTNALVYFDRALDSSVSATGTVSELATFRYYFRLNAVDANNNVVASAVTGYQDHVVQLSANAAVHLKLVSMPAWDVYDYDRLEVEIYRTKQATPAPFYKVVTVQMDFDNTQGYVNYTDTFADTDLIELDAVSTALKGTELGLAWQEPLRAKYLTSIGNNLVLGYLKDYPQLDLQLIASGAVTNTTYAGKRFLFRRDSADTGTTTDCVNRVALEMINGTSGNASAFAIGTNTFHFTGAGIPGSAGAGSWVYLSYSTVATSGRDLTYAGWWQIATVVGTTVTINLAGAAAATNYPDKCTFATSPLDVPVLLGVDGNLGQVNGDSFDLFDLTRRMSLALNSAMRQTDTALVPTFTPWLVSRSGNDVGKAGRIVVRQPRVDSTTMSLLLPSTFTGAGLTFEAFVNDIRRLPGISVSATTRVYPSRIAVSYENYPEIFDNPTAVLEADSDSVIDVNSADGQEITGILPFFGTAAFGAAQQSAILVVFKTNSIYLVDINEKRAGRNPIQRIETEGLGCTAPYSIAVSKNGIMFANESGIYCLRKTQAVDYIGKHMERFWTEQTNLDQLAICQGHHYGVGRAYKLSVPLIGSDKCSEVFVYNHTGEDIQQGQGAWSRYDNHPATGWANLGSDAYFGASTGRIFSLRNTSTDTDCRDDASPISFILDTRALDFGNEGIRKVVDATVVNYRTTAVETEAQFLYSLDLSREYSETTSVVLRKPNGSTGIDDQPAADILPLLHKTDRRRAVYFQARILCQALDEPIEVAGMSFKVGGLNEKGIRQAAQAK